MENYTLLQTIKHPDEGTYIQDWEKIDVDGTEYTIYYKLPKNDLKGFYFYVVDNITDCELAECLMYGSCYFDGMRHIFFGDHQTDNYGYIYCLDLQDLQKVLGYLFMLEIKHSDKLKYAT